MISPDDIGERRPANHTATIALSIAAVLLLVVGAMSYRQYVRDSLEKEFAEKEARMMQLHGGGPITSALQPAGAQPSSPGGPAGIPSGTTVLYDAQGNPVYLTGAPPSNVNPSSPLADVAQRVESSLPSPVDPEIDRFQQSLAQARQQSETTEQRFNQLAANEAPAGSFNGAGSAPGTYQSPLDSGAGAEITSELPDFLRNAVNDPPGGNPEVEARMQRMRSQVMAAPSLAKVTSYDKDWGIVTFNAGANQGVQKDQRFAVRRGAEILGWIKVDQVEEAQSIAILVTKNRSDDTALKPEVGDDLIDFELF